MKKGNIIKTEEGLGIHLYCDRGYVSLAVAIDDPEAHPDYIVAFISDREDMFGMSVRYIYSPKDLFKFLEEAREFLNKE